MKKILVLSVITAFTLINQVQAQKAKKIPLRSPDEPIFFFQMSPAGGATAQKAELVFKTVKIENGAHSIPVPQLKGTLSFVKKGDSYSGLVFTDSKGKTTPAKLSGTTARQTTITIAL